jgi:hypothetical protein
VEGTDDSRWYLLLAFSRAEAAEERLADLDHWLARRGQRPLRRVAFGEPDGAPVFATSIRDLRFRALIDFLMAMRWQRPEDVQVMVREPGQDGRWSVIALDP